jgi:hypothetical protein
MLPTIKILLVTDDFNVNKESGNGGFLKWMDQDLDLALTIENSREFHVGIFTETLVNTNWEGFKAEITKAHRTTTAESGLTEAALKADRGADVIGFRFDKAFQVNGISRTIAEYDMIVYFAIKAFVEPQVGVAAFEAEASAIADFMEKGGGFFATGDHANFGGYLCGLIPRVRSMRRWWNNPPADMLKAPSGSGIERNDTSQEDARGDFFFENQSDEIPQTIAPKFYLDHVKTPKDPFGRKVYRSHDVLCTPLGIMNKLPDHMHEGACDVPASLDKRVYKVKGKTKREYPDHTSSDGVKSPLSPEIIAESVITISHKLPAFDKDHFTDYELNHVGRFGAIGIWDGHLVDQGRVIVDSTFHHFVDINLSGDRYLEKSLYTPIGDLHPLKPGAINQLNKQFGFFPYDSKSGTRPPTDEFLLIQWYYRNIIYWLIPKNRLSVVWYSSIKKLASRTTYAEVIGGITKAEFSTKLKLSDILELGQLVDEHFRTTRGACLAGSLPPDPGIINRIPWLKLGFLDPIHYTVEGSKQDGLASKLEVSEDYKKFIDVNIKYLSYGTALVAANFSMRTTNNTEKNKKQKGEQNDLIHSEAEIFLNDVWPTFLTEAMKLYSPYIEDNIKNQTQLLESICNTKL